MITKLNIGEIVYGYSPYSGFVRGKIIGIKHKTKDDGTIRYEISIKHKRKSYGDTETQFDTDELFETLEEVADDVIANILMEYAEFHESLVKEVMQ
jgi:hypothetical protein